MYVFSYFCIVNRKICFISLLMLLICFVIAVMWYYSSIPYYKPAIEQTGLTVKSYTDDSIRIAYIGDSWADRHRFMPHVIDSILCENTRLSVKVKAAGVGGLVSKEIYYSIFNNDEVKNIIEWGPSYCIISAGINDTNKKMGATYYGENMRLIISLLLRYDITPVVIEIPYYDIQSSFNRMDVMTKLRAVRSMIWTGSLIDCIDNYVRSYDEMLTKNNWQDKVVTIRRNQWNPDGYNDSRLIYVDDKMHLNVKGYFVLDSCIAMNLKFTFDNRDVIAR